MLLSFLFLEFLMFVCYRIMDFILIDFWVLNFEFIFWVSKVSFL